MNEARESDCGHPHPTPPNRCAIRLLILRPQGEKVYFPASQNAVASSATAAEASAIPRQGMKPTLSTSRRLLRRQLATSAPPNSVAAAIATDSLDTCIAAHPFAKRGPSPRPPQADKSLSRKVPHHRYPLLLANAAHPHDPP